MVSKFMAYSYSDDGGETFTTDPSRPGIVLAVVMELDMPKIISVLRNYPYNK